MHTNSARKTIYLCTSISPPFVTRKNWQSWAKTRSSWSAESRKQPSNSFSSFTMQWWGTIRVLFSPYIWFSMSVGIDFPRKFYVVLNDARQGRPEKAFARPRHSRAASQEFSFLFVSRFDVNPREFYLRLDALVASQNVQQLNPKQVAWWTAAQQVVRRQLEAKHQFLALFLNLISI